MHVIQDLLVKLASLQSSGNQRFAFGVFPSQRYYMNQYIRRDDDNIFFTTIIIFTLQRLKKFFTAEQCLLVEDITQKAVKNYPNYQKNYEKLTYNFWRKSPSGHFPNGVFFSHIKSLELPDDADDTVLVYLTQKQLREDAIQLKSKLISHSILKPGQFKNFPKAYQHYQAYGSFFCTARMPIDHSLCVLCNILYFIYAYELPQDEWDQGSLKLLYDALESGDYLKMPVDLAVHYPNVAIILYHFTRLIVDFEVPGTIQLIPKIKKDLQTLLNQEKCAMNRVILQISMLRLGMNPKEEDIQKISTKQLQLYPFFMFSKFSYVSSEWIRKLARIPVLQVLFCCEAYNLTMILEYVVLRAQSKS